MNIGDGLVLLSGEHVLRTFPRVFLAAAQHVEEKIGQGQKMILTIFRLDHLPTTLSQNSLPPQKLMNFYTKVLAKFVNSSDLRLKISVEITPNDGDATQKAAEAKRALRDLGLSDDIEVV